jgi:hypothetical protein
MNVQPTADRPEVIHLITPAQFAALPKGTKLMGIDAVEAVVGDKVLLKEESRGGYLPFGFIDGTEPADFPLKRWKIDYANVDMQKKLGLDKYKFK